MQTQTGRKNFSRLIIPILILLFTILYNPQIGSLLIGGYIVYLLISNRSGLYSWLAVRRYRKTDWAGAIRWFDKAARSEKAESTVLLSYSLVLMKTGDFEAAEKYVERAAGRDLGEYNENVVASMRGLLLWKQGNPRKAVTVLEELVEDFENTTLYGCLGALYLSEGMLDPALKHNQRAHEMDQYDAVIADNLARTYYLKGEPEKAEELWRDLIERQVRIPEPYMNMATLLKERGESREAETLLSRARAYPHSHLSYFSEERARGMLAEADAPEQEEPEE